MTLPAANSPRRPADRPGRRQRVLWFYDSIVDWMLANPNGKMRDCAEFLGKHPNTLSIIVNSDAFKAYRAERLRVKNEALNDALVDRLTGTAVQALDVISDRLTKQRQTVPLKEATKAAEMALSALGFGAKQGPAVQVNVAAGVPVPLPQVSPDEFREAQRRLRASEEARLIEASPSEASSLSLVSPSIEEG